MRPETTKNTTRSRELIEKLRHMTVGQLKNQYREIFAEESRSNHKQFLFRRIAWRIQANAEGGLSDRARLRALEVADDADLRIRAPRNFLKEPLDYGRTVDTSIAPENDPRLPAVGSLLVRRFQEKNVVIRIRQDGFECDGKLYRSLSTAVHAATGKKWNGFAFFGLGSKPGRNRGGQ
jgi:hypothetical protein